MAPEVNSSTPYTPYNGFRVDIFNLGIALLILITGKYNLCISKKDRKARDLFKGNYDSFWSQFVELKEKLSKEFKALFINMTLEDPSKIITINKILEDKWFEGLKEKIKELEDNLKKEFDNRKEVILIKLKEEREKEDNQMNGSFGNRGGMMNVQNILNNNYLSNQLIKNQLESIMLK
jgi:serine/threonine protein kinase